MARRVLHDRLSRFLRRRVLLLSADGNLEALAEPGWFGATFRKPLILLSRSLCHHQPYTPPARLDPSAQASAALLSAEVMPPFERSEHRVVRSASGFSIWSWNADRVDALIGGREGPYGSDRLPETLLHAPAEGARLVQLEDGQDAQVWFDGALAASLFIAGEANGRDWQRFLSGSGLASDEEEDPPAAEMRDWAVPLATPDPVTGQPFWERLGRYGLASVAALVAIALVLAGQGLRLQSASAIETARLERLDAARQGASDDALVQRQISALREWRSQFGRPDPIRLLAEAKTLANRHGLDVAIFTIDTERLRLGVLSGEAEALQNFALELEQSTYFSNVRPENDPRSAMTYFLMDAAPMPGAPS